MCYTWSDFNYNGFTAYYIARVIQNLILVHSVLQFIIILTFILQIAFNMYILFYCIYYLYKRIMHYFLYGTIRLNFMLLWFVEGINANVDYKKIFSFNADWMDLYIYRFFVTTSDFNFNELIQWSTTNNRFKDSRRTLSLLLIVANCYQLLYLRFDIFAVQKRFGQTQNLHFLA